MSLLTGVRARLTSRDVFVGRWMLITVVADYHNFLVARDGVDPDDTTTAEA